MNAAGTFFVSEVICRLKVFQGGSLLRTESFLLAEGLMQTEVIYRPKDISD